MIIECHECDSRVDAKILASREFTDPENPPEGIRYSFLECPSCHSVMVGLSYRNLDPEDGLLFDTNPTRAWPDPTTPLHYSIPNITRASIEEARACYKAKAYIACAVMCGRAIEGICVSHGVNETLAVGLKKLLEQGVIDHRLYDWGDSLRKMRNIGAHPNEEKVSQEDAKDVLDFAIAICEYVFVLNDKFEEFKQRQADAAARKAARAARNSRTNLLPTPHDSINSAEVEHSAEML